MEKEKHLLREGEQIELVMKDYRVPSLNVVLGSNRWARAKAKKECGRSILSALGRLELTYSTQTTSTLRISSIKSAMLTLSQKIPPKSLKSTSRKRKSPLTKRKRRK